MLPCLSYTPQHLGLGHSHGSIRSSQEAFTLLQNCTSFRHLKQIHATIIRAGLSNDQFLITKLIHLCCSSFGQFNYASHLFNSIPKPLTITWNFIIRSFNSNGCSHQALLLFKLMISRGFAPDKFTFPFVIKACVSSSSSAFNLAQVVHGLAIKTGFSNDVFLQNNLMDCYFNFGHTFCACKVFEKMPERNVVSWTTMVSGLVDSGDLATARAIFERMPTKNVVSWTAMIDGYAKNQQPEQAFQLFKRMQTENIMPNEFTLVSLLKACTELGSLNLGKWIHDFALENGFKLEVYLGTALIDMYSKCGSLEDARKVFDKMKKRSLATWNAMITSLGVYGFGEEALALFAEMEMNNVEPDAITFVGVLCACVQTNDLTQGCEYFEYMSKRYGISPIPEHYSCLIELYSRADMLDEVDRLSNALG